MSLHTALRSLPDDRGSATVVRTVLRFFVAHRGEDVSIERLIRATGADADSVRSVVTILSEAFVLDCGAPDASCRFDPSAVLDIEVATYLRSTASPESQLRRGTDRFRSRFGTRG